MSLFHLTLAITTFGVGNASLDVPVYKTVVDFVPGGNGSTWQLIPYQRKSGEIFFTAAVACFFLLSSLFHALNATVWRDFYFRELEQCRTPTRWTEYFFSAPLMMAIIAYTLGIRDRSLLLAVAALVAATMPYGYWTEMVSRPISPEEWGAPLRVRLLPWALGHVPQVVAWLLVILQFYDGNFDPTEITPAFVHAILWAELILFFSFGFAALGAQLARPKYFYRGELAFQVLSLVSKGLLGILLIANVLMLSRFEDLYDNE